MANINMHAYVVRAFIGNLDEQAGAGMIGMKMTCMEWGRKGAWQPRKGIDKNI